MFDRLRPHLNHSTIVAYMALFVALGGVSYAAATGSIGSRELKNNSVRSADLRNNDITSKDIRNATVNSSDVADGSLTGADVNESTLGAVPVATSADTLGGLDSTRFVQVGGAAGGALSGTFPNPGLADGAVTRPKLADNAVGAEKVADGSLRIADLAVWSVGGNIGGTTSLASACHIYSFATPTGALADDLIIVRSSTNVPEGLALEGWLHPDGGISAGTCNYTANNIALPNPFILTIYGLR